MRSVLKIAALGVLIMMISANAIAFYRMMGTVSDVSRMPIVAFLFRAASGNALNITPSVRLGFDGFADRLVANSPKLIYNFANAPDAVLSHFDAFTIDEEGHGVLQGWSITKDVNDYVQYVGIVIGDKIIEGSALNTDRVDVEKAFSRSIFHPGFNLPFQAKLHARLCQIGVFVLTGRGDVNWLQQADEKC